MQCLLLLLSLPRRMMKLKLKMVTTSRTVMMSRRMSRTSIVRTELFRRLQRLRDVVLAAVVRRGLAVSGVLVAAGGAGADDVRDRAAVLLLRAAEIASLNQLIGSRAVLMHGPLIWVGR